MIEIRHLTKKYGVNVAVNDLSLTLEPGNIYGFLGPNGAGKTTTMNIITGYIGATAGEVIINGHDINKEPEQAKQCIGYLPEQPPVYGDMRVMEYLRFVAELKGLNPHTRGADIRQVVDLTRLSSVEGRLIRNLSKGYKQRVGLAQALMGLPEIIILDEPTVGLDPKQIIEIRDLIALLREKHTVILSSHILQEISAVCDHVFIISKGNLVASDTMENLEDQMSGAQQILLTLKATEDEAAGLESIENIASCEILDVEEQSQEPEGSVPGQSTAEPGSISGEVSESPEEESVAETAARGGEEMPSQGVGGASPEQTVEGVEEEALRRKEGGEAEECASKADTEVSETDAVHRSKEALDSFPKEDTETADTCGEEQAVAQEAEEAYAEQTAGNTEQEALCRKEGDEPKENAPSESVEDATEETSVQDEEETVPENIGIQVRVSAKKDADVREDIFYYCAEHNIPILEMSSVTKSLEDVFLELTEEKEVA